MSRYSNIMELGCYGIMVSAGTDESTHPWTLLEALRRIMGLLLRAVEEVFLPLGNIASKIMACWENYRFIQ